MVTYIPRGGYILPRGGECPPLPRPPLTEALPFAEVDINTTHGDLITKMSTMPVRFWGRVKSKGEQDIWKFVCLLYLQAP